jgi:DNA polymerase elongation subunit (family B)
MEPDTIDFDPYCARIITLRVGEDNETITRPNLESSEREVISSFLSFTDKIYRKKARFIGYNLLKFDVPLITERMHALGLLTFRTWERLNKELPCLTRIGSLGTGSGGSGGGSGG